MATELERVLERLASDETYSFEGFEKINYNTVGHELETPLHLFCLRGDSRAVRLLLDAGADINARTDIGATPLMRAIRSHDPDTVDTILSAKPDLEATNQYGKSFRDIFRELPISAKLQLTSVLEKHGLSSAG
jgi:ankyrin repeat protein